MANLWQAFLVNPKRTSGGFLDSVLSGHQISDDSLNVIPLLLLQRLNRMSCGTREKSELPITWFVAAIADLSS
jgi:hypothetical protein